MRKRIEKENDEDMGMDCDEVPQVDDQPNKKRKIEGDSKPTQTSEEGDGTQKKRQPNVLEMNNLIEQKIEATLGRTYHFNCVRFTNRVALARLKANAFAMESRSSLQLRKVVRTELQEDLDENPGLQQDSDGPDNVKKTSFLKRLSKTRLGNVTQQISREEVKKSVILKPRSQTEQPFVDTDGKQNWTNNDSGNDNSQQAGTQQPSVNDIPNKGKSKGGPKKGKGKNKKNKGGKGSGGKNDNKSQGKNSGKSTWQPTDGKGASSSWQSTDGKGASNWQSTDWKTDDGPTSKKHKNPPGSTYECSKTGKVWTKNDKMQYVLTVGPPGELGSIWT